MKDTLRNWLPALLKEAELGNRDAMGILAVMYRDGISVEKDEQKAQHYFKLEQNAPPFEATDGDDSTPWLGKVVEV